MAWENLWNRSIVTLGGGFVRIWRPGQGLSVELPACVVWSNERDEVLALGEEAAALEGKLPPRSQFIRPVWSDRIIDRTSLRLLLQEALRRDGERAKGWASAMTRRYVLRVPESTPLLHQRWLLATCREVWPLPWKVEGAYASIPLRQGTSAPVRLYLDLGFSALHMVVFVGDAAVIRGALPAFSLHRFCERLRDEVLRQEHVRVSASAFYSFEWFTQQAGFDERQRLPVLTQVSKVLFQRVLSMWVEELSLEVNRSLASLPKDVQAQFSRTGVSIVGGGAEISEVLPLLEKFLHIPVQIVRQPKYATLREKER